MDRPKHASRRLFGPELSTQQDPGPDTESQAKSRRKRTQDAQQRAEEAERIEKGLDKKLAEKRKELNVLKRFIEAESKVQAKKKKLAETEKQLSQARDAFDAITQASGQPEPSTTPTSQSSRRRNPVRSSKKWEIEWIDESDEESLSDDEEVPLSKPRKPEELPGSTDNRTAVGDARQSAQELQGYTSDFGERVLLEKRGEWSEKRANEILGLHIRHPMIQTTLNYFESFMTEKMLQELKTTMDQNAAARQGLGELRKSWGGPDTDYFLECAESNFERRVRRTLSWNKYFHSGYLVCKYGGSTDQKMDPTTYKETFKEPLFGYGELYPDPKKGDVDPKNLTNLYKAFLRTAFSSTIPCFAHEAGLLGSKDICSKCGVAGSVTDLS